MTEEAPASPLAEANPASLDELINRTPDLTDAEIDRVIEALRAQREKFAAAEAAPKKPKAAPKGPKPKIDLSDIL
jgi:hypothetical protein